MSGRRQFWAALAKIYYFEISEGTIEVQYLLNPGTAKIFLKVQLLF